MLATFSFYILSAMPARSPGAIVGDFANPIERPFFLSLRPTPRRDVSIPFACLLSASFLRLRRFFSIDITPSRLPIARTEKFRTTQQSVRFFYWLLSCFRYSKRAPFLSAPSYFFCHSFYSSPRGRQQRTTERRQQGFYDRVSCEERKTREIILALISVPYRRYVDNREFPCRCMARYENEGRSSWSEVLFTLDYVQLLWHRYTVP